MDFVIQKCTELGVNTIIPLFTARTVVKWDEKTCVQQKNRWQRIAREAAKQCGRSRIPEIRDPASVDTIKIPSPGNDMRFVLHEKADNSLYTLIQSTEKTRRVQIVVGPEGGFGSEELAFFDLHGFEQAGLGPRILRTETAGVVVLSIVQYAFGDFRGD